MLTKDDVVVLNDLLLSAAQLQVTVAITFYDDKTACVEISSPAKSECFVTKTDSTPIALEVANEKINKLINKG